MIAKISYIFLMESFHQKCKEIRKKTLDLFVKSGRGHLPSSLSTTNILVALYYFSLRNEPELWKQKKHDPIILSKGHGCLSLYAILNDKGFITQDDLNKTYQISGVLGGHPSSFKTPGIELSTGSLGHGFSFAIGKALAYRTDGSDRKVAVILGDGECNEGSTWEAAIALSKHNLTNLITIIDYNRHQSYSSTEEVFPLKDFKKKWQSFSLNVIEIDMVNSPEELVSNLSEEFTSPTIFICHTIKGQGISFIENNLSWHHKTKLTDEEITQLYRELN